jgi:hypothetical protein
VYYISALIDLPDKVITFTMFFFASFANFTVRIADFRIIYQCLFTMNCSLTPLTAIDLYLCYLACVFVVSY